MKRSAPGAVEQLLKRKKVDDGSKKKPKFLSKRAREELKQQQQQEEQRQQPAAKASVPLFQPKSISEEESRQQKESSPEKKRIKRSTKAFKFDWDEKEDTLDGEDYLYTQVETPVRRAAEGDGAAARRERQRLLEQIKKTKREDEWDDKGWWEKPLEKMQSRDWRILKEEFQIATTGNNLPNPIRYWQESSIPEDILRTIDKVGYKEPSNIQRAAIPVAMSGRDVKGVAETGSGKTAAFVIPMLSYIRELPALTNATKELGPYAIVLAPARELAQQIANETKKFAGPLGFNCISMVGGHKLEEQAWEMGKGAEIVVATPGRLLDNLEKHVLVLSQCCYVVMDEADQMISLGFEEQVNRILHHLPATNSKPLDAGDAAHGYVQDGRSKYRQTMMFTATLPPAIEKIAEQYLRDPATITIGRPGGGAAQSAAAEQVEQLVEFADNDPSTRMKRMLDILNKRDKYKPPMIVFVKHQKTCDDIARFLNDNSSFRAVTLHGRQKQDRREQALKQLRSGDAQVLVATDVAGRGIDIPNVSLVLNFNMARSIEAYTHRIGRTGRAGKRGTAITFLGKDDEWLYSDLVALLSTSKLSKIPEELKRHAAVKKRDTRIKD